MIRLTHFQDYRKTGQETVVELSFGQAVNDLFSRFAAFAEPYVGVGPEAVTVNDRRTIHPLRAYSRLGNDQRDFCRLWNLAMLLDYLIYIHRQPEQEDFTFTCQWAARQADGRETVQPSPDTHESYYSIQRFAIEWLIGHEIENVPLVIADEAAATYLALEAALDGTALFEDALREFLALV